MQRITNQIRGKVNNSIYDICKGYHKQIPLEGIFNVLKANGLTPIQEDKTEWAGMLCGANGSTHINFMCSNCHEEILNSTLVLTWYKMESGNYEVTAYLS